MDKKMDSFRPLLGKRGGAWLPSFVDAIVLIVFTIIIIIVFGFFLFYGKSAAKDSIQEAGQGLKNDMALDSLLRTPVRTSILLTKTKFDPETTLGEIIVLISAENDKAQRDSYTDILSRRMQFILDRAYGENNWKIRIIIPGNSFDIGGLGGGAYSSEALLPSSKGDIIKVDFMTKTA